VHVAKIDILFDIFYCRDSGGSLIVIIKIKEFYFSDISSIRIDIFCSFCRIRRINKIDKIDRTRYCTNSIDKILKSILLLFRKVDVLLEDI